MAKEKDSEDQKKKEEEIVKEKEKRQSWIRKVPPLMILVGIVIVFIRYQSLVSQSKELGELFIWAAAVVLVWYLLAGTTMDKDTRVLTPKEAFDLLVAEVNQRRKDNRILQNAKVFYSINDGLQHHEGMPDHYIIGMTIRTDRKISYKKAVVIAVGETKGYITIQGHPGEVQGTEALQKVVIVPGYMKRAKKWDLDIEKILGISK